VLKLIVAPAAWALYCASFHTCTHPFRSCPTLQHCHAGDVDDFGDGPSVPLCTYTPVNCTVSEWSDWTECSVPCGGGTQNRTRDVITPPANGGEACPVLEESRSCNQDVPCTPVNCSVSDWSSWTPACTDCTQIRTRTINVQPQYGGLPCPTDLLQTRVMFTTVSGCQTTAAWLPTVCGTLILWVASTDLPSGSLPLHLGMRRSPAEF
jgi:hypothetical protein